MFVTRSSVFIAALLALSAIPAVAAVSEGRTADGRPFVTGGVGQEEVQVLKTIATGFPVQLVVSSREGAYLADVDVRITSAKGETVLDARLPAPWLLVDLAPGTYAISVTYAGKTQQRKVTVLPGKREQLDVQFDVPADTAKSSATAAVK